MTPFFINVNLNTQYLKEVLKSFSDSGEQESTARIKPKCTTAFLELSNLQGPPTDKMWIKTSGQMSHRGETEVAHFIHRYKQM